MKQLIAVNRYFNSCLTAVPTWTQPIKLKYRPPLNSMTQNNILEFKFGNSCLTAVIGCLNIYLTDVPTETKPIKLKFGTQLNFMTLIKILVFTILYQLLLAVLTAV